MVRVRAAGFHLSSSSSFFSSFSQCVISIDYSYWTRTTPMAHMTVHIALDDETSSNGGLCYVPCSHKWPLLPITSRHFNDMESIRKVFLIPFLLFSPSFVHHNHQRNSLPIN